MAGPVTAQGKCMARGGLEPGLEIGEEWESAWRSEGGWSDRGVTAVMWSWGTGLPGEMHRPGTGRTLDDRRGWCVGLALKAASSQKQSPEIGKHP